jgi:hypothetical protein
VSSLLRTYQDSLGAYLDGGGNVYLDGLYLVEGLNSPGALGSSFLTRYMGSTGLHNNFNTSIGDSSVGWSNRGGARTGTFFRSGAYGDTMRAATVAPGIPGSTGGIRAFVVPDTMMVALWATDSQLSPPNVGFEAPVAVTVPQASGGRLVVVSMPIRIGLPANATIIMRRILFGYGLYPGVIRPGNALVSLRR